jgi:hypothetical protein
VARIVEDAHGWMLVPSVKKGGLVATDVRRELGAAIFDE